LRVFRDFGDKVCNNKIEKRSVSLQELFTEKKALLISSSFTKVAEDPHNSKIYILSNETESFSDTFLSAILLFIPDERRCALKKFSSPAFLRIGTFFRLLGSALVILGVFFFPMLFLGGYPAFYWPLLVNDWLLALPLLSLFFVLGTSIVGLFQITVSSRIVIWTRIAAIVGLLTHCLLEFWAYAIFSISLVVHIGPGFGLILLGFMVMIVGTFLM
jgi:hypothetical protein